MTVMILGGECPIGDLQLYRQCVYAPLDLRQLVCKVLTFWQNLTGKRFGSEYSCALQNITRIEVMLLKRNSGTMYPPTTVRSRIMWLELTFCQRVRIAHSDEVGT
jgi:hypothetical protein